MEEEKMNFLKEFSQDYGYPNSPKNIDQIRASEFKRLEGLVYLDHAGATLYSELQMESILKDFTSNVYGNPHSQSDVGSATSDVIRSARQKVLEYCNAPPNEYKCIFTSGATAALKLVGECFPWSRQSSFMHTMENHNSVLGIREYALNKGATSFAVDIEAPEHCGEQSRLDSTFVRLSQRLEQRRNITKLLEETSGDNSIGDSYNLFAFPSECNFSGVKFSLDLVKIIKEESHKVLEGSPYCRGHWMVLIDAAKGCTTQPPDLAKFPADFVVISFYKMFGYPTGLGALLVRTEAAELLKKTYFSGGTVAASIADIDVFKRREGIEESFEDGTQSFLSIASIHHGFKIINTLTISSIARHTTSLATYTRNVLFTMRHTNGTRVCILYGGDGAKVSSFMFGPTIAFNLKRPDGTWTGYREVEKMASLSGIQLRAGCFCNPGACAKHLILSHQDLLSNIEAGHVCWDDHDILNGKPTGAVRISFGYMSTFEDAKKFIDFIVNSFVSTSSGVGYMSPPSTNSTLVSNKCIYLKTIAVYPIKSCGGFSVDSWPLSPSGLKHDRDWLLKSPSGEILTQKKVPEMRLISTYVDLSRSLLFAESPRCVKRLQIDLSPTSYCVEKEEMQIQSQRYEVAGYESEVNLWFTNAIGRPCSLLRCFASEFRCAVGKTDSLGICMDVKSKLSFVNEAQILLISEESISDLNNRLSSKQGNNGQICLDPMRFRPNLIIAGAEPFEEDEWESVTIGQEHFTSFGGCNRCEIINLDPQISKLQRSKEPLATLASFRRMKGKILFGILLRYEMSDEVGEDVMMPQLQVGQRVYPHRTSCKVVS